VGRVSAAAGSACPSTAAAAAIARTALAVVLAIAALGGSTASALVVALPHGEALSYMPTSGAGTVRLFDKMFTNLDYNGGSVMSTNTNHAFYWDPSGAPAYPSDYQPGVDTFFDDLAHDSGGRENVDSVAAQYNDAAGQFASYDSHFGGALVDTNPYPANGCTLAAICLTDGQIRAELSSYIKANGLPHDLAHEYFVLMPPGVESCFEPAFASISCSAGTSKPTFCAYHGYIPVAGEGPIVYANDPYVAGSICDDGNHPNGTTADATISGGLSHEHDESITDPEPNSTWTDWATGEKTGYEVGDKCRVFEEAREFGSPLGTAPNGSRYNQVINGHLYWYQQEWSNQGHRCLQRLTFSGAEPTATFTAVNNSGTHVEFDASASTAPGGVLAYEWQFDDAPGLFAPIETTTSAISHEFPSSRVWRVALTVFAADGTSIGTEREIPVGKLPKPVVAKVTPLKGPAAGGTAVAITGNNLGEARAVRFGPTNAASFTVKSAKSVIAISPPGTAEVVDVTVTTPVGTSPATTKDHFTLGPPTVTGVSPASGPKAGGTSVTILGSGFRVGAGAMSFKFGAGLASEVDCTSTTTCTVRSPAAKAAKTVDVIAVVGKASSTANPPSDQFSFQ
jgi:hypothetical protein